MMMTNPAASHEFHPPSVKARQHQQQVAAARKPLSRQPSRQGSRAYQSAKLKLKPALPRPARKAPAPRPTPYGADGLDASTKLSVLQDVMTQSMANLALAHHQPEKDFSVLALSRGNSNLSDTPSLENSVKTTLDDGPSFPTMYSSDLVMTEDRKVRFDLAKKYNVPETDVDKINKIYDGLDCDSNGTIDWEEFKVLVRQLFGVKKLEDVHVFFF